MRPEPTSALNQGGSSPQWKASKEVGSLWGIAFVARIANWAGRPVAKFMLLGISLYFYVTQEDKRQACIDFRKSAGADTSFLAIYFHFYTFAVCAMDRLFFLQGKTEQFCLLQRGHQNIQSLLTPEKGAILLGSHLGSFEALRAASRDDNIPVNIVADFENAQRLSAILSMFGDNEKTRFLDASGDRISLGLAVKEAVDRGELVAILADRAGHGRSATASFFGRPVDFPVGAYLLAYTSDCPLYFTTSVYTAPNRYELIFEAFASRVVLPRRARQEALDGYVQQYAHRLEHYARLRPDNWFNFYPYWATSLKNKDNDSS